MDLTKLSSTEVLALTIYGEARGEVLNGMIAVGDAIRNRVNSDKKNTYNTVCLAREQFSCWNSNDPNYPILTEMANQLLLGQAINNLIWIKCLWVAEGIVNNFTADIDNGAKYYMTNTLFNSHGRPSWASLAKNIKVIGNQTYFSV